MYAYDNGQFMPIFIPFIKDGSGVSFTDQARILLDAALNIFGAQNPKGIYITYSANQTQTRKIAAAYAAGNWKTGIAGDNQASVIMKMEDLLSTDSKYKDLQGVIKIAPITTIPDGGVIDNDGPWTITITEDLTNIKNILDGENIVFGWTNQETAPKYAHALNSPTGVIQAFPTVISDLVQNQLNQFANDYPVKHPSKM